MTAICEEEEVGMLCSLSFAGMLPQVQKILEFKARNSQVPSIPNYYKILYSFYVSKGDYLNGCPSTRNSNLASFQRATRINNPSLSAAKSMYNYGKRLGEQSGRFSLGIAGEEARAFLASINALSLLSKPHSFFVPQVFAPYSKVTTTLPLSSLSPLFDPSIQRRKEKPSNQRTWPLLMV